MEPTSSASPELDDANKVLITQAFREAYPIDARTDAELAQWATATVAEERGTHTGRRSGGGARVPRMGTWTTRWWRAVGAQRPWYAATHVVVASGVMALLCVLFLTHTMRSGAPRRSQVYQTAAGHRAKVQLAGGSTMLLGPSTLAIVTGSDVTVTGEAYFNIAPKSARAVTVTTANVIVQVLGTAFVVRQYPGEMHATVAVDNGKIGVRTRTDSTERSTPTVVTARMVATVTDQQVTIAHDASAREYTGWVSGVLVFRHAALQDVVAEVGRAYGSEIRIADSALARRTISVELDIAQSSLTQVLDIVGLTLHAHYQRDGGTYVLASGRKDNSKEEKQRGIHIFDSERHYGR